MECPSGAQNTGSLLEYSAGRLDPESAALLERHLEGCEACRGWVAAQRAVGAALDDWTTPAVSPDFDRKLYERIELANPPRWWNVLSLRPALSMALASGLIGAALLIHRPDPAAPAVKAQIEAVDADRLESALEDVEVLRQLDLAGGDPANM